MENYIYQNNLISKKQLREILRWTFTKYDSMDACALADELKYLGFKYATQSGISISIEDLQVPFKKNKLLMKADEEILDYQKVFLKGKITDVERFQKIIDTWGLTSEFLKNEVVFCFKNYYPLNSVYIMSSSGARGSLSQVRQLVGMRGLMSDPSGEIMNLPIKKNFREGLTITDYLMSGYGARKGIVDTALKTANSGYLTRRLIDVAQDIVIREKDCYTSDTFVIFINNKTLTQILGRVLNRPILDPINFNIIALKNTQITPTLIETIKQKNITQVFIRSPLTCKLYRALCQKCYGWDLATQSLVELGEAVGILAGQSIGEPGTQLTMRTFHTGGVFNSTIRKKLLSPGSGLIRFSKALETSILRTNRGENVLVTKSSGILIIIPDLKTEKIINVPVERNTIIFPQNNQYVQKNAVLGEIINLDEQLKQEIKPFFATTSGEIYVPNLKNPINKLYVNKLVWILSGDLYYSPLGSYLNYSVDYKLNKNSFIFRTKIISSHIGKFLKKNNSLTLYKRFLKIQNKPKELKNSQIYKLPKKLTRFYSILYFNDSNYLLRTVNKNKKVFLKTTAQNQFGRLITPAYKTRTGGMITYDFRVQKHYKISKLKIFSFSPFHNKKIKEKKIKTDLKNISEINNENIVKPDLSLIENSEIKLNSEKNEIEYYWPTIYRTLFWTEEETYILKCDLESLLVNHGDFIAKNFEILPDKFSQTAGLVLITEENGIVDRIVIRSGLVYESLKFKTLSKKLFFPGEVIFSKISIVGPCLCEQIRGKVKNQLFLCPVIFYEFPHQKNLKEMLRMTLNSNENIKLSTNSNLLYKPNQIITSINSIELVSETLDFPLSKLVKKDLIIELTNSITQPTVEFTTYSHIKFNKYIKPELKYKKLNSCILLQPNQFIDHYTVFSYLESLTSVSVEIIKFKVAKSDIKKILLISNNHCSIAKKTELLNKKIGDFILNSPFMDYIGKIIFENKEFFIVQKGRPYFFPNCKLEGRKDLRYQFLPSKLSLKQKKITNNVFLNQYDRLQTSIEGIFNNNLLNNDDTIEQPNFNSSAGKIDFSRMFLKKNGNLYTCLIPRFSKTFTIGSKPLLNNIVNSKFLSYVNARNPIETDSNGFQKEIAVTQKTLLMQSSNIISNTFVPSRFTLVKFLEYPFVKSTKSIGLCSITDDFSDQRINSVFCKDKHFVEIGETIGFLNFEKEITGDIVQGLPRIEEILEARKKKQLLKRIRISQKKGLLAQKSSLDRDYNFIKLGTPIKENEKINSHKLLKIYFNYYGFVKLFLCGKQKSFRSARLVNNFEGSYKSFKKVQSFILNSVQNVYYSQGVRINNKHLELIIKQMTTKVLVSDEGNTPLLTREIIDLYHMKHVNNVMLKEGKKLAYYFPLLFGITRSALNNPSFISAASFQETTKVLTKAAIDGRMDWLRGLKENIILGHLIPAGTGRRNYNNTFKKPLPVILEKIHEKTPVET